MRVFDRYTCDAAIASHPNVRLWGAKVRRGREGGTVLQQLRITNFKSWESLQGLRLGSVTGLFGANSSGKTSILQSLLMLRQTVESPDRQQVLHFGGASGLVDLGGFRDVVFRHDTERSIELQLDWQSARSIGSQGASDTSPAPQLGFKTQVALNSAGALAVPELSYSIDDSTYTLKSRDTKYTKYELQSDGPVHLKRTVGRAWDLPKPYKCYGFPDQVRTYYQDPTVLADLELSLEQLLTGIQYLGPLRDYPRRQYQWSGAQPSDMGPRGQSVVEAFVAFKQRGLTVSPGYKRKRRGLDEMVALWLQKLGLIHSFRIMPIAESSSIYQVLVRRTSLSPEVLITDVGFGVSQVLPAITLCYYAPRGSIIVLEQPEIHLHPSVQSGLADVFLHAAKTQGIQIVVESHSEHLLRRLQRRVAEGRTEWEVEVDKEDVALYFCDAAGDHSSLVPLQLDLYGSISNWPRDFFGDEFEDIEAMALARALRRRSSAADHGSQD